MMKKDLFVFPSEFESPYKLSELSENEKILVAFSGGADSSALLDMVVRFVGSPKKVFAAHVDHLIRPDEHLRDLEFCKETAKKYGIKLFTLTADVPMIAKESGESLETAARRIRYEFFESLMAEHGIKILATAHNADDNLETLILNLTRGSGMRGMCGIPPVRQFGSGYLVRPILKMSKDAILSYCKENSVGYVTDSTNAIADCSRNIIRLNVIPELKKINPSVVSSASRMSGTAREDDSYFGNLTYEFLSEYNITDGIPTERINALPSSLKNRVFIKIFGTELETVHLKALTRLCLDSVPHSSVSLPGIRRAVIENGKISVDTDSKKNNQDPFSVQLVLGGNRISDTFLIYVSDTHTNIYKSETTAAIASDKICGSLYARNRLPGDRILMGGMHKSLKKLMCDQKIDLSIRDKLPIICDGDGIVFVPFVGICDRVKSKKNEQMTYISLISG